MNPESLNADSLGDIISSLSPEDIASLQSMAQNIFGGDTKKEAPKKQPDSPPPSQGGFDFASMAKIASIMSLFSNEQKDPRCDLLNALRPLIASEKQQKVDQAIKMLKLLSVLPKIKELNS
ncbi:MAG: hypothetical protein ACI4SB_06135 [Acutalibacteraceae bacterium]